MLFPGIHLNCLKQWRKGQDKTQICRTCTRLTFDDLLGAGVVDLLLGGVGGEHLVEHVRLPLWRDDTNTVSYTQFNGRFRLLSTPHPPLWLAVKSSLGSLWGREEGVCVWKRGTLHASCSSLKRYVKPYCHHINIFLYTQWTCFMDAVSICVCVCVCVCVY